MTELVDVRVSGDQVVVTFREGEKLLELALSGQAGANLVAGIAQAVVELAPPNAPGVEWLKWPQMAHSSEVSFDIEAIGSETVGIAVKLPGLLPLTVEIPPGSARAVAEAIAKAADDSEQFRKGLKS